MNNGYQFFGLAPGSLGMAMGQPGPGITMIPGAIMPSNVPMQMPPHNGPNGASITQQQHNLGGAMMNVGESPKMAEIRENDFQSLLRSDRAARAR